MKHDTSNFILLSQDYFGYSWYFVIPCKSSTFCYFVLALKKNAIDISIGIALSLKIGIL